jgi:hypothetical protein
VDEKPVIGNLSLSVNGIEIQDEFSFAILGGYDGDEFGIADGITVTHFGILPPNVQWYYKKIVVQALYMDTSFTKTITIEIRKHGR